MDFFNSAVIIIASLIVFLQILLITIQSIEDTKNENDFNSRSNDAANDRLGNDSGIIQR